VLALTGPAIALRTVYKTDLLESLTPGAELESAIKRQLGLLQVNVSIGSTTTTGMRTGASTTSYQEVSAQAGATPQDDDALMLSIARMVLDRHPDLLGKQTLIVRVSRSFDLGIASWSINRREALDAAAWQAKLKEVR
jgi:outer membrane lipopolysaccharide assembly protein LptE/RlpB